jgi:hypothetical protein
MDNARLAFEFFVNQGLSPVQAAGIVGNLQGESGQGLNPNAVNRGDGRDGSDSVGIGQWNSSRAQALKDFAAAKGTSWSDLNTQLEFLHSELQGPEKKAYDALQAAKTPEEAARAFLGYERPKDWNVPGSHPERLRNAAALYAAHTGGQPQPAPASPVAAPSAPLNLPMQAPVFPAQPVQQAQAQPDQGTFQMSGIEAPPIFYAPRPAPNLSKLKAAFKAPTFRGS